MNKLVPISATATSLSVSTSTLRRWDVAGKLKPSRTECGQGRYDLARLLPGVLQGKSEVLKSIACACVSSHDQKADLKRQQQVLELYCASQVEIITEFSARLYRSRSHKNQKLIVGVRTAVKEAQ